MVRIFCIPGNSRALNELMNWIRLDSRRDSQKSYAFTTQSVYLVPPTQSTSCSSVSLSILSCPKRGSYAKYEDVDVSFLKSFCLQLAS